MPNKILTIVFVLFIVLMYANMAKAQIVENGLISYWAFDEDTIEGKTVKDVWGPNHGTIEGNPELVEGHLSEAMEFHGSPDRVRVSNHESLALSDKFTIEAWAKVNEYVSNAAIVGKGTGSGLFVLQVVAPDQFKVRLNDGKGGDSHGWWPGHKKEEWYHLAMVVDGRAHTGLKLYVNGELMPPISTVALGDIVCANDLFIGFEERNGSCFIGVIDEVRIYNRLLEEEEIELNFRSTRAAVEYCSDKLSTTWAKVKKAQ